MKGCGLQWMSWFYGFLACVCYQFPGLLVEMYKKAMQEGICLKNIDYMEKSDLNITINLKELIHCKTQNCPSFELDLLVPLSLM